MNFPPPLAGGGEHYEVVSDSERREECVGAG